MDESFSEYDFGLDRRADGASETGREMAGPALPMLHAYLDMMRASALIAAGRIGLFEALAAGPLTNAVLATALGSSEAGLARLTKFLIEAGHLKRQGDRVANAPATMRWFTSRGDTDYTAGLVWTADAWEIMGELTDVVRHGAPARLLWDRMDEAPELGARFARYMRAFAHHLAPDLARLIELPDGPARLLDLGGSHGVHSIALCRQHPELEAAIVDLDSALQGTSARIRQAGLASRIAVRPADIRDLDWGEGYDVVLYLSIAHNMTAQENERIFAHMARAMRHGGKLIIHDYPAETTPGLFGAAFGLTLLVETGTRTFGYAELAGMLARAGFSTVRYHVLSPAEKGTIIIAQR